MKKILRTALLAALATTSLSGVALADDLGGTWSKERFQFRVRAIDVMADGDGEVVQNPALKTDVRHSVVPEVDVTYFFTKNIAAELIAATSEHEVDAGFANLGEAWILPPTLTLQYHFMPDSAFSPYVGAGLNYSLFYGETDGFGYNDLEVEGGVGYALQAGFDYWLNDNWGLNLDAKYVDLDVDVDVISSGTLLEANEVDLDPWIIGAGVSYRF